MAESILITISDVQPYRRIDPKFNTDRFNAFAMEVQRTNLRNLLEEALYLDFFNNITDQKYIDLRDGKEYVYGSNTIKYYGLIPCLVYWWLAIATREGSLFHAGYGAVQFVNNPQQNFETSKEKESIAISYTETAQGYANDVIKYLNQNSSTYPLWPGDQETNQTNLMSFKL